MIRNGRPAFLAAILCFALFAINVLLGAYASPRLFGDRIEMLALFAATLFFVAGILAREAAVHASRQ